MTDEERAAKKAARKEKRKKFWSRMKKGVASAAPLLGGLVAGPLGGQVGDMISDALGINRDDEQGLEKAINDPAMAARLMEIQENNRADLEKLRIQATIAEAQADAAKVESINKTMRVELTAKSGYRAGWRPLFGYIAAIAFGAQMLGITYVIIFMTEMVGEVLTGMGQLTALWAIALAVLGVNIRSRTQEKSMESGNHNAGKGFLGLFK